MCEIQNRPNQNQIKQIICISPSHSRSCLSRSLYRTLTLLTISYLNANQRLWCWLTFKKHQKMKSNAKIAMNTNVCLTLTSEWFLKRIFQLELFAYVYQTSHETEIFYRMFRSILSPLCVCMDVCRAVSWSGVVQASE